MRRTCRRRPVSGIKKSVMMVFAGMFVGFLISLLAVVLLTSSESKAARTSCGTSSKRTTSPCRWIATP